MVEIELNAMLNMMDTLSRSKMMMKKYAKLIKV